MQNDTPLPQDDQQQPSDSGVPVLPDQHNTSPAPVKSTKTSKAVLFGVAAAIVLLAAGGFYGYQRKQHGKASQVNITATEQAQKEFDADAASVDEAALAEDPQGETTTSDTPASNTPARSSSNGNGVGSEIAPSQPQPRNTEFRKGGSGVYDGIVSASANLSANETGTCTFKFRLNGTVRVEHETQITNSKVCAIEIRQSEFLKSAIYSFELTFKSSDGMVTAVQEPYDIEIK